MGAKWRYGNLHYVISLELNYHFQLCFNNEMVLFIAETEIDKQFNGGLKINKLWNVVKRFVK